MYWFQLYKRLFLLGLCRAFWSGRLIQCEAEVYHLEMEGKEMRKRIVSSLLLGCALLTGGVSTAYTVHAEDSQTQTGTATIILVNNCDWEDSSGFQFLLDEDHDTYGDVIPDSGPLSRNDDVPHLCTTGSNTKYLEMQMEQGIRKIVSHMVHQPKLQFRQEHMIMLLQIQHQMIEFGS